MHAETCGMDRLYKTYGRLLAETDLSFTRYLYEKINWNALGRAKCHFQLIKVMLCRLLTNVSSVADKRRQCC